MGRIFYTFLVVLLVGTSLTSPSQALSEDWNFTREDYASLRDSGKSLRFEADSDWFPPVLRENLKITLEHVLDPKLEPPSTYGINLIDFDHGHVACEGFSIDKMRPARNEFNDAEAASFEKYGLSHHGPASAKQIPSFIEGVIRFEAAHRKFLDYVLQPGNCTGPMVIYHTFETEKSRPSGMLPGDPLRNIQTRLGEGPRPYAPPDINSAGSWLDQYKYILSFYFLIDERGVIHVTAGLESNLVKVTRIFRKKIIAH